ncbi:helix-turn-helix domain-containing protein [Mycobacterium sp. E1386]|uniref:helix-turn-helix domain-containing protein n=1 Tax=Mycobacterium sp. E1386 TaxID=1834126 RepID=UPI0009EE9B7F|nr:helix-turn-helix domain-containing protein [Mycobacterium sp. E1386]
MTQPQPTCTAVDAIRPQPFVSYVNPDDGSIVVPQRVAQWLHQRAPVPYELRLLLRERDPELYSVLTALRFSAMSDPESWPAASGSGRQVAKDAAAGQDSGLEEWLTVKDAAAVAGVSDRAIRDWAASNRLTADKHGRAWRINRKNLQAAIHTA